MLQLIVVGLVHKFIGRIPTVVQSNNMIIMGLVLSIVAAGGIGYVGYAIRKHEQRDLKVGCEAATPEMIAHEGWDAVVSPCI